MILSKKNSFFFPKNPCSDPRTLTMLLFTIKCGLNIDFYSLFCAQKVNGQEHSRRDRWRKQKKVNHRQHRINPGRNWWQNAGDEKWDL